jgi:hypothetical protein
MHIKIWKWSRLNPCSTATTSSIRHRSQILALNTAVHRKVVQPNLPLRYTHKHAQYVEIRRHSHAILRSARLRPVLPYHALTPPWQLELKTSYLRSHLDLQLTTRLRRLSYTPRSQRAPTQRPKAARLPIRELPLCGINCASITSCCGLPLPVILIFSMADTTSWY